MVSFESILNGEQQNRESKGINYNRIRQSFTDFSPGSIQPTQNPFDLAINGNGFFKLQGPEGTLYTRRGDFAMNDNGVLTTGNGLPVLDESGAEITIPTTDGGKIAVGEDGTIYLVGPRDAREEVAKIAIVDVADKLQLKHEGDTTFSLENGGTEVESEIYRIIQGSLELSNVNMTTEMAKMIDSHRIFETYHKVLKNYGTISEKQDELGTVG